MSQPEVVTAGKPRLHQSTAVRLVNQSPLHGWHHYFRREKEEYDKVLTRGNIAHALLLGGKDIVSVDAKDWRTNAAKEQRDAAIADGKLPILVDKLEDARLLTNHVRRELEEEGIILSGQSEMPLQWTTLNGVEAEGRLDHFLPDKALILDFKFVSRASMHTVEASFVQFGYDIQGAAYVEAVEREHSSLRGRVKMLFIFIEVDAPNAIRIAPVGGTMRRLGEQRWERAQNIWRDCLEKYGTETPWPSYADNGLEVQAPAWALNGELIEAEIAEGGNL